MVVDERRDIVEVEGKDEGKRERVLTWSKTSATAACAGGARKRKKVGELEYLLRHCCRCGVVVGCDDDGSGKGEDVVDAVVTC